MERTQIVTPTDNFIYLDYFADPDFPPLVTFLEKGSSSSSLEPGTNLTATPNPVPDEGEYHFSETRMCVIINDLLIGSKISITYNSTEVPSYRNLVQQEEKIEKLTIFLNHRIVSGLFLVRPPSEEECHLSPCEIIGPELFCETCLRRRYGVILTQGDLLWHGTYHSFCSRLFNMEFYNFPTLQGVYRGYSICFTGKEITLTFTSQLYDTIQAADAELDHLLEPYDYIEMGRIYIMVQGNTPSFIIKNIDTYRRFNG